MQHNALVLGIMYRARRRWGHCVHRVYIVYYECAQMGDKIGARLGIRDTG